MAVLEHLPNYEFGSNPKAATRRESPIVIGNFDGLHLGHQELIKTTAAESKRIISELILLTFDPLPKLYFEGAKPTNSPLYSIEQRLRSFYELGVRKVLVQKFDDRLANLSPEDFYVEVLRNHLGCRWIGVGDDFRFGKKREGSASWLQNRSRLDDVGSTLCPQLQISGDRVSSSRIRKCLSDGSVSEATKLLGRPFQLSGQIVQGRQIGRQLGVPTMNLDCSTQLCPTSGVYTAHAILPTKEEKGAPVLSCPAKAIPAVVSIGNNATFSEGSKTVIEVHLLQGEYPLNGYYGNPLTIYLRGYIRPHQKFDNLNQLKQQIFRDIDRARKELDHI